MGIVYIVCVNSSLKHSDVIYEKLSIPITKRNDYGLYTFAHYSVNIIPKII